jgi:hypothetical protein
MIIFIISFFIIRMVGLVVDLVGGAALVLQGNVSNDYRMPRLLSNRTMPLINRKVLLPVDADGRKVGTIGLRAINS